MPDADSPSGFMTKSNHEAKSVHQKRRTEGPFNEATVEVKGTAGCAPTLKARAD